MAPVGLSAVAGDTQVVLTWTASAGATSYNVKRAVTTGGPYTSVGTPTAATYTNTGLTNGTKYYYVVTAVNAVGASANSGEVSATPVSSVTVPSAPTVVVATAGDAQVVLDWTVSSGATSYHVKRATTAGGPYTQVSAPTVTTYTNTGLTNGTKYYYVVTALNSAGESSNSSEVSATPVSSATAPSAPTNVVATAGDAQVVLTWTASTGAISYRVKRATTAGGPYTQVSAPTVTTYTNTGLTNGTKYYYVVTALNSAGESSNSSEASATPVAATPGSPINAIEFGRTLYGSDDCLRPDIPAGGSLFSVWTMIPSPGSTYPWSRGNMDVYVPSGENWYMRCLDGNCSATSPTVGGNYNANSMLFTDDGTYVADYSFYFSPDLISDAVERGWIWVAWQVIVNADSFTIRQWLKYGLTGDVIAAGESNPTFAEIRSILVKNGWSQSKANAWVPGDATHFQVGRQNGYLCHARMAALSTVPSLTDLNAIATASSADLNAWADYELNWENGAPNLTDRSGHGRNLTIESGGTLHQGPVF